MNRTEVHIALVHIALVHIALVHSILVHSAVVHSVLQERYRLTTIGSTSQGEPRR